jgi:hypothetical protein
MLVLTNVLSTGNRSSQVSSPGESARTNVGQMGDNDRRNRVHITHMISTLLGSWGVIFHLDSYIRGKYHRTYTLTENGTDEHLVISPYHTLSLDRLCSHTTEHYTKWRPRLPYPPTGLIPSSHLPGYQTVPRPVRSPRRRKNGTRFTSSPLGFMSS